MNIEKIIDEAYDLYMPQDRYEITELAEFVLDYAEQSKQEDMITLEIGTKFGGTFYIWCSLFNMEGDLNISIDMSDGGIHGGISEEEMDKRDRWFKRSFGNCHFIRGDSHDVNTRFELFKIVHNNTSFNQKYPEMEDGRIDFLFIDGDHSYEGVKQDFEMYSPFVKPGGLIAFHDINDTQRHRDRNVNVAKFWNEIKNDPRFDAVEFNSNLDWAGIGLLIVKQ